MELLHLSFVEEYRKLSSENKLSFSDVMENGDNFKEAFFYSGVGAYDDQYVRLAVEKYSLDEEWIKNNRGFSIKSSIAFFENLQNKITKKLNDNSIRRQLDPNKGPVELFCLSYQDLTSNNEDFKAILENFSTHYGSSLVSKLDDVTDYNAFGERPIIKLLDGSYFISIPFAIAEAIYETPFYWMSQDVIYKDSSFSNRGKIAETITYSVLTGVFGDLNVFKGVEIKKNKSSSETDIDVLVLYESTAIIFQVKAKKLTSVSKQGNITSIRNDFNKAVENAFLQGRISRGCIVNPGEYNFITDNGLTIKDRIQGIRNTYIVSIVLDDFPAITHALQVFLYNKYEDSAIALSVADLDVICRTLQSPKKVIDYFAKRINNCRYYHADSETSFLGFYLKHDLKPLKKVQGVAIDSTYSNEVSTFHYTPFVNKNSDLLSPKDTVRKYVGRNEKCPCGSKKKYKKCCLLKS